jgi:hypothetical protein
MWPHLVQVSLAVSLPPAVLFLLEILQSTDGLSMWADRGVLVVVSWSCWVLIRDLMRQLKTEREQYTESIKEVNETLISVIQENNTVLTKVLDGLNANGHRR